MMMEAEERLVTSHVFTRIITTAETDTKWYSYPYNTKGAVRLHHLKYLAKADLVNANQLTCRTDKEVTVITVLCKYACPPNIKS